MDYSDNKAIQIFVCVSADDTSNTSPKHFLGYEKKKERDSRWILILFANIVILYIHENPVNDLKKIKWYCVEWFPLYGIGGR